MRRLSHPLRVDARCVLAGASGIAALVWAIPCRAGPCRVEVRGSEPAGEWHRAARAFADLEPAQGDCASILLDVRGDGARLTFTTLDGRSAERMLDDPYELAPTVAALRVTGGRPEPPREPPPEAVRDPAPVLRPTGAPKPEEDSGAIFALQAGARGGHQGLVSPVLAGSASLALRRWELGVAAAFELQYFELGNDA